GAGPEQDPGAADGEGIAVHQGGGIDPVALDVTTVGGSQVGGDNAVVGDADLQMLAGDAGVVHDDVGLGATPDHCDRTGEQVSLAVDVHDRVAGGGCGGGGRGDGAAAGGGIHPELSRFQSLVPGEGHLDRPDEDVVL